MESLGRLAGGIAEFEAQPEKAGSADAFVAERVAASEAAAIFKRIDKSATVLNVVV